MQPAERGAYGFRLRGLDDHSSLLVEAEPDWPTLELRSHGDGSLAAGGDEAASSTVRFLGAGARIELGASAVIEIEREPPRAVVRTRAPAAEALIHPYLGAAASVVARWHGRESFHAGAFLHGSGSWVVLGPRTAGKSSLLASLHSLGCGIVADDVVVVEEGTCFAAPRTLDLRLEAAERLGLGVPLGRVGARERWRVELGPVPPRTPLRGFVYLEWAETLGVDPVLGHERLAGLGAHLTIPGTPVDASAFFELASLPSVRFRRPRDWGEAAAAAARLLDAIS